MIDDLSEQLVVPIDACAAGSDAIRSVTGESD